MKFSLLYTDEMNHNGAIDLQVFADLGLTDLFEDIYEGSEFFEIIKYIPVTKDIKMRQDIFADFHKDDTDAFNEFRIMLHKLLNYYQMFTGDKKPQFTDIYYFLMLKEFTKVVSGATKLFSNRHFKSTRLSEISGYLLNLSSDSEYQNLLEDIDKLERTISVTDSFVLNVNDRSVTIVDSRNYENLNEELTGIATNMGINLSKRQTDSNRTLKNYYINGLLNKYADEFTALSRFYQDYKGKFPVEMGEMTFEIEFYLNMKRFYEMLLKHNIKLCIPKISRTRKIKMTGCQDIFLIQQNVKQIVPNDIEIGEMEHIQIITGVNSGGKTSFLRAIGISQLLFYTGGYVPCSSAELYPFKHIVTHFPTDEKNQVGYGRLKDEEERLHQLAPALNRECLLLLNETYSSTYETKAVDYAIKLLDNLLDKQVFCFFVTHLHRLLDHIENKDIGLLTPLVDLESSQSAFI